MVTQEQGARTATFADLFGAITDSVQRAIQGKPEVIDLAVLCLVSEGHLLLEDVPGVGRYNPFGHLSHLEPGGFLQRHGG